MIKNYISMSTLSLLFAVSLLFAGSLSHAQVRKTESVSGHAFLWSDIEKTGYKKEVTEKRSRYTKHFELNDGSMKMYSSPGSMHYQTGNTWEEINLGIQTNTSGAHSGHPYFNGDNSFKTWYPQSPMSGKLYTSVKDGDMSEQIEGFYAIDQNGNTVYTYQANTPQVAVSDNMISYSNLFPNTIVRYAQQVDGRKLDVELQSNQALSNLPTNAKFLVIKEKVTIPANWTVRENAGYINLFSGNTWVANFLKPTAFETQSPDKAYTSDEDFMNEGEISMTRNGNVLTLYTKFSLNWLKTSNRQFPVRLDPTISFYPPTPVAPLTPSTSMVTGRLTTATGANFSGFLRVGAAGTYGWAKFNISTLPAGATITTATYIGYQYSPTGTAANKIVSVVGMQAVDPEVAVNSSTSPVISNQINTVGPVYNSTYVFGSTNPAAAPFNWRSAVLTGNATADISNQQASQGWTCLGFKYTSGNTATMLQRGIEYVITAPAELPYLTLVYSIACTGTPVAGTATASVSLACSDPFTLNLVGNSPGSLTTFQWQSSPAGLNTWTNLGTAQSSPNFTTTQSSPKDYRCIVTCTAPGGASSTSTVLSLGQNTNNGSTSTLTETSCDSYTWGANGLTYTASGVYTFTSLNSSGCVNTATLNLTINPSTTNGGSTATACNSYTWNGSTYTTSSVYTYTSLNASGCTNTSTFNLTVNYSSANGDATIISCDSYTWNGSTYTTSGVYTYTSLNASGCTNTATLNLTVNYSTTNGSATEISCDSYTWNGSTYTTSGVYTYTTLNASGCTNTATLNVSISDGGVTDGSMIVTACDSYTWNGTTYYASGTYSNCSNTATLTLSILNTTSGATITSCDSYTWNGTTYTTSGVYTYTSFNASGCTNTATLNLTINYSTSNATSWVCDSYTWNGTTYTTSGVYTALNAQGCASLNLTIIYSSATGSLTTTSCNSYTWYGNTYSTSGVYIFTSLNASGCVNTATLNLTVNYSSTTGSIAVTACNSYLWNGSTYTTGGVYSYTSFNAAGCVNTATLNLSINNSTSSVSSQTACDSYTWSASGVTYTISGVYTKTTLNAVGCVDTATLGLTLNAVTLNTVVNACDSYVWAANGQTYTSSGSYTFTSSAPSGCINTATLNLIVDNSTISSISQTTCNSYTWAANGMTYSTSGAYTNTSLNAAGCVHTATLNLTMNAANSCNVALQLKLFIQGYYDQASTMLPVLLNQLVSTDNTLTDTILVELHSALFPYVLEISQQATLHSNGTAACTFNYVNGTYSYINGANYLGGNLYYVAIRHRNGLLTWSANPIAFDSTTVVYDFSTSSSKAYGDNMLEVEPGVWAMYSADLNQDQNVDLLDMPILEADIAEYLFGYAATDLNGDGNTDLLDVIYMDYGIAHYLFSMYPVSVTLPTLGTNAIGNITYTTASSGGIISSNGGAVVTARGVCWSTSPNPTVSLSTKTIDGIGSGSFTSSITGLVAGTTYYVRAYATNSVGTAYGNQYVFTTAATLAIGQIYQGGIIAYILQPGDPGYDANVPHGLIAAPSNQSGVPTPWGCSFLIGVYGTGIGTGNQNTLDIMNGCSEAGIAARLCGDLVLGGYSDWYLPSTDELNKLYINRIAIGGFNFDFYWNGSLTDNYYWSSTEVNWGMAGVQNFSNGFQYGNGKDNTFTFVRAVRAF